VALAPKPGDTDPMNGCWLYIVRCADGSLFVGTTRHDDPARQVSEHNSLGSELAATCLRRPVKLAFAAHFDDPAAAMAMHGRISRWSDADLEDLMAGRREDLLIASTA
jgi:putative endonuclease